MEHSSQPSIQTCCHLHRLPAWPQRSFLSIGMPLASKTSWLLRKLWWSVTHRTHSPSTQLNWINPLSHSSFPALASEPHFFSSTETSILSFVELDSTSKGCLAGSEDDTKGKIRWSQDTMCMRRSKSVFFKSYMSYSVSCKWTPEVFRKFPGQIWNRWF
jgi:hypothetical protein